MMRALITLFALTALATAQSDAQSDASAVKAASFTVIKPHALHCIVDGKDLGKAQKLVSFGSTQIQVCSDSCEAKVKANPEVFVDRADGLIIANERANYPLETCPITGLVLGAMGKPVELVLNGHLVKLCCGGCISKAKAQKDEITAKVLAAAHMKQSKAATVCVTSKKPLAGKRVDVLYGNTLLAFCNADCVEDFEKNPAPLLKKLGVYQAKPVALGAKAGCCGGKSKAKAAESCGSNCGDAAAVLGNTTSKPTSRPSAKASSCESCESAPAAKKAAVKAEDSKCCDDAAAAKKAAVKAKDSKCCDDAAATKKAAVKAKDSECCDDAAAKGAAKAVKAKSGECCSSKK